MPRTTRTIAGLAVLAWSLAASAQAQSPAPPQPAAAAEPAAAEPADAKPADAKSADAKPADAKPAEGGYATDQTYKMKSGGMYQPPAERPTSPAQDYKIYNRT